MALAAGDLPGALNRKRRPGAVGLAWRWAAREGTYRFSVRHLGGLLIGVGAAALALVLLFTLRDLALRHNQSLSRNLAFLAPVQQSGSALNVEVTNAPEEMTFWRAIGYAWPALLAIVAFTYGLLRARDWTTSVAVLLSWFLLAWAALRSPNGASIFFLVLVLFL